jgi:hypothetical protein
MVNEYAAFLIVLGLASVCLAQPPIPPNGSFEEGDESPTGWSLSGGSGRWEQEGYSGNRSVSVTGTGEDSNYWLCDSYKLGPRRTYRVAFVSKVSPDATGGNVITGLNVINRDYSIGTDWEEHSFVFTTPDNTDNVFLRFGQWQKDGKVWFDNIQLKPVIALHHRQKGVELGAGEIIQDGVYKARPNFRSEGTNSSRILFSHTSSFNSTRWTPGNDAEVIYHHKVGDYKQKDGKVSVEIGYYQRGKCLIEASSDNQNWNLIGEISGLTRETFNIPDNLFPAEEIYIRLRGAGKDGESASLQIYGYEYEANLAGDSIPDMEGSAKYLDIMKSSESLDMEVLSLGDLKPGYDNSAHLRLTNKTSREMPLTLSLSISGAESADFTESTNITARESKDLYVNYEISKAGDFALSVSAIDAKGDVLNAVKTFFQVPQLYAADYGYLLSRGEKCSIWWAEGTHKISRERPVPKGRANEVYISAARNEYEPFQVVLKPTGDMGNISVDMEDLTDSEGNSISRDNVEIARVGYVYVKVPTDKVGCVGYWPDPLPPYKKPFSVKAGQNQPLWITVYVPKETPAGDYRGNLTVSSEGWSEKIDIHLHVWNFSLPEETHVRSGFGFSIGNVKLYHHLETDEEVREVADKYYQSFAAHRISPYYPMSPIKVEFTENDAKVDFEAFDRSAKRYLDEFGFTGFRLPLRGMGGGTFHSRHLGNIAGYEQGTPEHEALFTSYLRQIQDHLEANGWLDKAYVYWFDEPSPRDYDFVKDGMSLIHRAAPKITRLLTEQPVPELYGSVDLWCPVTYNYNHEIAEERRESGEHFWWYVCTGPKEPYVTLFIDHYATEMRLWLWQTWKYKVEGILIWQSNYWTSSLVFPSPSYQNPYEDPMSYQTGYGRPVGYVGYWGNGDGRFFYPPVEAMEDRETKCLSEPVSSIRWELLREGIEDYEYFWLLRERIRNLKESGKGSESLSEAEKLLEVPENIVKNMTEFTIDPNPIYSHREKIARMIEELSQY